MTSKNRLYLVIVACGPLLGLGLTKGLSFKMAGLSHCFLGFEVSLLLFCCTKILEYFERYGVLEYWVPRVQEACESLGTFFAKMLYPTLKR